MWNTDYEDAYLFINNLRYVKNGKGPPKLFILANYLSYGRAKPASSCIDNPIIVMKPLRASMLAASLQRIVLTYCRLYLSKTSYVREKFLLLMKIVLT